MRQRRGYFLIEVIGALLLIAVAAILMSELFVSSMKAIRSSNQRQETAWRYDHMVSALRRDVGRGLRLNVKNSNELEIDCGPNDMRRWVISTEGVTRLAEKQTYTWSHSPKEMTFEPRGRIVILHVPAAAGTVTLAPPMLLAGETQP